MARTGGESSLDAIIKRGRTSGLDAVVLSRALSGLGKIFALTVGTDGTIFGCTSCAIYTIAKDGGFLGHLAGSHTEMGYKDGRGTDARFNQPCGIAVDLDGSLLVADTFNHRLRRVSANGRVSTVAGSVSGFADGEHGSDVRFHQPWGIAVDTLGTVFVCDLNNHCIRVLNSPNGSGAVSTLCGSQLSEAGFVDGEGATARFNCPAGLALDSCGNLIIADLFNHCVRKVTRGALNDARVMTLCGSPPSIGVAVMGFADGDGAAARFEYPQAVAVDGNDNILVADRNNNRIRKVSGEFARVTTLAGSAEGGKVDGPGVRARFNMPWMLALDSRARVLVADCGNIGCLRVLEAAPHTLVPQLQYADATSLQHDLGTLFSTMALADVTFAVDGQRFPAHRCLLAARSAFFQALFESSLNWREEGCRMAGRDIHLKGLSAGAFRVLLRFLYTHTLPEREDCGEHLECAEMARIADQFQAVPLYKHCVRLFRDGLRVANTVERLVQAHDSQLPDLEAAVLLFLKRNARKFQREGMSTLSALTQRPDLMHVSIQITTTLADALVALAPNFRR